MAWLIALLNLDWKSWIDCSSLCNKGVAELSILQCSFKIWLSSHSAIVIWTVCYLSYGSSLRCKRGPSDYMLSVCGKAVHLWHQPCTSAPCYASEWKAKRFFLALGMASVDQSKMVRCVPSFLCTSYTQYFWRHPCMLSAVLSHATIYNCATSQRAVIRVVVQM